MLTAGTARTDITPPNANNVYAPLDAKVLIVKSESTVFAIISCDMCGIRSDLSDIIRGNISSSIGIPFDNIAISCTHNHSDGFNSFFAAGTGKEASYGGEAWEPWLDELAGRIVECVNKAASSLKQVYISSATASVEGISAPARLKLVDGGIHCLKTCSPLPWKSSFAEEQPVCDNTLLSVRFTETNGTVLSHIVNFSCHANSAALPGGKSFICGDYPAFAMKAVESRFGGTALFLNGACADIYPVDYMEKRGIERAEQLGIYLADAVIALDEKMIPDKNSSNELNSVVTHVKLRRRRRDMEQTLGNINAYRMNILNELVFHKTALNFEQFLPLYSEYLRGDQSQASRVEEYLSFVKNMEKICSKNVEMKTADAVKNGVFSYILPEGSDEKYINATLQAFQIGDASFVFFPGELFTRIGIDIKKESPFPKTGIVSLTNASIGYIPTDEAFDEGGYQLFYALIEKETEVVLHETALELLAKLNEFVWTKI